MLKLLFILFLAALGTTFAIDNMHRVELGLIVGKAVNVRLFFLLLIAFLVGCFTTVLANLYFTLRARKQAATADNGIEKAVEEGAYFSN